MRPSRIATCLLLVITFLGLSVSLSTSARAACAATAGQTEHQRLVILATDAPTVFVGTVVSRGKPREFAGGVYTPVTFGVAVFLHGKAQQRITLLTPGGALPGQTVVGTSSEAQTYESPGLQLAAAHREHGELVTEDVCYGGGQIDASMVRELIAVDTNPVIYDDRFGPTSTRTSTQLPSTGSNGVLLQVLAALLLILVGCGLTAIRIRT